MAGSTVVMAFEPAIWKRMRELRPDLAVCALYSARMLGRTTLAAELETLRAAGVGFVGLEHTVVDTAAVARARQAGIQVGAWTVNDAAAMQRLIDAGVGLRAAAGRRARGGVPGPDGPRPRSVLFGDQDPLAARRGAGSARAGGAG